jgi:hypothetical protein
MAPHGISPYQGATGRPSRGWHVRVATVGLALEGVSPKEVRAVSILPRCSEGSMSPFEGMCSSLKGHDRAQRGQTSWQTPFARHAAIPQPRAPDRLPASLPAAGKAAREAAWKGP